MSLQWGFAKDGGQGWGLGQGAGNKFKASVSWTRDLHPEKILGEMQVLQALTLEGEWLGMASQSVLAYLGWKQSRRCALSVGYAAVHGAFLQLKLSPRIICRQEKR